MEKPMFADTSHHAFSEAQLTQLKVLQALYETYRDYMKHEDDLLNQRTTWHLLSEGFLFAALGAVGQWKPEADNGMHTMHSLVYVLAFTGIAIAIAAFVSILAANIAIEHLCDQWKNRVKGKFSPDVVCLLPGLAGAGSDLVRSAGKMPAQLIPCVIIVAWAVILFQFQ